MSTQINVIVDNGGLSERARQQTQAKRFIKLESDNRRELTSTAVQKRNESLAAKGIAPDRQPLYSSKASLRVQRDEIAANRILGMIRALFLPPTEVISPPAALPPGIDPATVRRCWRVDSTGFQTTPIGIEKEFEEEAYIKYPLFEPSGAGLTIPTSACVVPPTESIITSARASGEIVLGGIDIPFAPSELSISATVADGDAGQTLIDSDGVLLASSGAGSGVYFGSLLYVSSSLVQFLGETIYSGGPASVNVSLVLRGEQAKITLNEVEYIRPFNQAIPQSIACTAFSTVFTERYYLVAAGGSSVPFLSTPSSAGSFGNISIEAKE